MDPAATSVELHPNLQIDHLCLYIEAIDNAPFNGSSPNKSTNSITVDCSGGLCQDITISAYESGAYVELNCIESSCFGLNVSNPYGLITVNINGTNQGIYGKRSYFLGESFNLSVSGSDNKLENAVIDAVMADSFNLSINEKTFKLKGNSFLLPDHAKIECVPGVQFEENVVESMDSNKAMISSMMLTLNAFGDSQGMDGIKFVKSGNEYRFESAENVLISILKEQEFVNSTVNVLSPSAVGDVVNEGLFFGNVLNAEKASSFTMECGGECRGTNTFNVKAVEDVHFVAANNAEIGGENAIIVCSPTATLSFTAQSGGSFNNLPITKSLNVTLRNSTSSSLRTQQLLIDQNKKSMDISADFCVLSVGNGSLSGMTMDCSSTSELTLNGMGATFKGNEITLNEDGILNINGDGQTTVTDLHLIGDETTNYLLSIANNIDLAVSMKNKSLIFKSADFVNISVNSKEQSFEDHLVEVSCPDSAVYIENIGGSLLNNTFRAEQADIFSLKCLGHSAMNTLLVENVTNLALNVGDFDEINGQNTSISAGMVENLQFILSRNGKLEDLTLNEIDPHSVTITVMKNASMNNVSIDARNAEYLTLQCLGGCHRTNASKKNTLNVGNVSYIELFADHKDAINGNNINLMNMNDVDSTQKTMKLSAANNASISDLSFLNLLSLEMTANGGTMNNVSVDAHSADLFKLECIDNGCRHSVMTPNQYRLDGAQTVLFEATNDEISGFVFGANQSMMTKNVALICNENGEMNNFEISTLNVLAVTVKNNEGMMDRLVIGEGPESPNVPAVMDVDIKGALTNSVLYAKASQNVSVRCSNVNEKTCSNLTLYIPHSSSSSSSLLCQNEGCQDITFWTEMGMDDLTNLTLSDCPCSAATKSSCLNHGNEWSIFCEANKNGKPSVFSHNKCEGECCGDVVDRMKISSCDYNGDSDGNHSAGAIVGGVCGGVLLLVVVVGAVYYYRKKKNAENAQLLLLND